MVELKPYAGDDNKYSSDTIYVKTHRSFATPLSLLNRVKQSANTEIRIVTDVSIIETDFNDSRAYLGLVNFNKRVLINRQHNLHHQTLNPILAIMDIKLAFMCHDHRMDDR